VKTVAAATGPTKPGGMTELTFEVDCQHPFITALGMIAPSPDWIVTVPNKSVLNNNGRFVRSLSGDLIAYDAGTDSGREFTNPADESLDMPTEPKINIAPLVEDETDRFSGRSVGHYFLQKM
jgi:hypothetical protein